MKADIIRIGNSKGIRIPATLLKQLNITRLVDMEATSDSIVIRPSGNVRAGWEDAFKRMAVDSDVTMNKSKTWTQSGWDEKEWEW